MCVYSDIRLQNSWGDLSDRLVVQLGLQLLRIRHFSHRFHKVLLDHVLPLLSDCIQSGLGANIAEIGTGKALGQLDHGFVINRLLLGDFACVDFQDL